MVKNAISIHVPREGDDPRVTLPEKEYNEFQSTSPVRGTTLLQNLSVRVSIFQSTSPVRGTTLELFRAEYQNTISIHVPREGDDLPPGGAAPFRSDFNPRPP